MKLKKKNIIILCFLLMVAFIVVFGSSYAYFTTTIKAKEFVIYTGNLAVNYSKKTNVIALDNLYPMTNEEGLSLTPHEFSVTNSGNIEARYQIRLELDETNKDYIPLEYINISYKKNDGEYSKPVLLSTLNSSLTFISNQIIIPTKSDSYAIKLWIDLSAPNDIQGKTFKAKVVIDSIQNVDDGYKIDTRPIITLNKTNEGTTDINLKTNEEYQELGVEKIEDDQDIFITSDATLSYEYYDGTNLTTVNSIDTSKNGIYYITYSVTDKSNNVGKAMRIVTVNSSSLPSITLNGEYTISLEEYDEYQESGVTVTYNNKVVTIGEVKTSTVGAYLIRYIVIDKNGNMNSVIRIVNINPLITLHDRILTNNSLITAQPTLTSASPANGDASGLYMSTETNIGDPTYYFRGNVENNYVKFADKLWRIVRINEDGTVRLIMQDGINNNTNYAFNSDTSKLENMYYSNSEVKTTLEDWYSNNISVTDKLIIAKGAYYCEEAKVKYFEGYLSGVATMVTYTNYIPNFICSTDGNNNGLINSTIGLLTNNENLYAGGYFFQENSNYYLYNNLNWWLMSPGGFNSEYGAYVWNVATTGDIKDTNVYHNRIIRPVINLKTDTLAKGTGTSTDPYVVITKKLNEKILANNEIITATPTLTTSSNNSSDASGLYMSTETNSGDPTYYFRGNVENNYVEFADKLWRIVRINEDGTTRLIMQDGINDNATYAFNSNSSTYDKMYYTNSEVKGTLEQWYNNNINISLASKEKVATGDYYCEEAKVKHSNDHTSGNTTMTLYSNYKPSFKCSTDDNKKGIVNVNVGLITYDEVVYAGGHHLSLNQSFYLNTDKNYWTMSPAGFTINNVASNWHVYELGKLSNNGVYVLSTIRPVINLKADTFATGTGTSSDPYKIVLN